MKKIRSLKELFSMMGNAEFEEAAARGAASIDRVTKQEHLDISRRVPFHMIGTYSNLTPKDFESCRLADLDREHRPHLNKVLPKVHGFTPDIRKGFYFHGRPGSGKTRLLKGLCIKWALKGVSCQFWTVPGLIAVFKKFDLGSARLDFIRKQIIDAEILVLDDFGTEGTTEFVEGELLRLIDDRAGRDGSLHISSNIPPQELAENYSPRVLDRLKQLVVSVQLDDASIRGRASNKATDDFWSD